MKPIEILLIEDNPGDVRLTIEALQEARVANHLSFAKDGEEAIAFLQNTEGKNPFPDLILLDLNLPRISGAEVLEFIKNNGLLKRIPVVILTTSQAEQDIVKTYNLHANCYINKPVDFDKFIHVICMIGDFWLHVVKLPPR
ncbi:MAG: response regulator [Turneriella sp.]|nr:response regulator [Turneriella sp.]